MSADLLLEIGTEEIPSDYLEDALKEMQGLAETRLREHRIAVDGGVRTFGTPRRLVLAATGVAAGQEDTVQEITGPPKQAAFDAQGHPTPAALGFAKSQGVAVEELQTVDTPKGEYLYVRREIPGRPTPEILARVLPELIAEIPWPKSMRWGSGAFSFVRPIHWVLALYDGRVLPFEVAGVQSGDQSRGHRFTAPRTMEVEGLEDYLRKMAQAGVMIDQKERERRVEEIVAEAAGSVAGVPSPDPELVTKVANLVEFPSAVCGGFEKTYLDLPEAVLITAMREHQKYFAVRGRDNRLMPNFVAVNNTEARDRDVVRRGHERVLRARLADAGFFFREDRKRPLEERLDDLKTVIYQAELGTSHAKVERFARLAESLARRVASETLDHVRLAARLCKCDLVTEMVMEFPSLQGTMGKAYARLDGHPEEVCLAIEEHYLPGRAGGELPSGAVGAIVGVADRMDTIAGCFAIGLEPTGAADPFALRRHALAIIRIAEARGWDLSLQWLISESLSLLKEQAAFDPDPVAGKISAFFRERYKQMILRAGYESDLVEAALSAGFDRLAPLRPRIDGLKAFAAGSQEFESLVLTFKRVSNILKKQGPSAEVDPALFKDRRETRVWDVYEEIRGRVEDRTAAGQYLDALNLLLELREPVDDLFEGVEILSKTEPQLRENRVAMLQRIAELFRGLADFSRFSI